jgi:DNA replication and repair protein RecF
MNMAGADIHLSSQLHGVFKESDPEAALLRLLQEEWLADIERQSSGTGSHRDDVEIGLEGKSLRLYGSQGEQRAAVLALLLGGKSLAREQGGREPVLLLDDVMSELEPSRRRRLMRALAGNTAGQALITAADRALFTEEELSAAAVHEVCAGTVSPAEEIFKGKAYA